MRTKHSAELLPIFSLLTTATLWGVAWYPLRLAENNGLHGLWITVIIYSSAMLIGITIVINRLEEFRRAPWILLTVAIGNAWCNVAFILAVLEGNVVRVLLLFYLSPLWSTVLGWLLLREHMSKFSVLTLVLAMIGAVIMLWDPEIGLPLPHSTADWLAISSGLGFSISNIAVRKLQDIPLKIKVVSSWMGVAILAAVWIIFTDLEFPNVGPNIIGITLVLGTTMVVVMTITVQYGVTHMPVYRSAVILLFELVAGTISSQLLTDEKIAIQEWIGGTLIILAAYISARSIINKSENN